MLPRDRDRAREDAARARVRGEELSARSRTFIARAPTPPSGGDGRFLVGYVGIMALQDGVDRLVRAMAHIRRDSGRTDVGCVIIGDGPEFERVKALAERTWRVGWHRLHRLSFGQPLLAHLSAVDVGVIPDPPNPSNDKMSMNKVFEYMTMGIPFVHFDLAQCRSESADGGIVVEQDSGEALGEAILALLRRPGAAAEDERRRRGPRRARVPLGKPGPALLAAYDLVLKKKPARAAEVPAKASN